MTMKYDTPLFQSIVEARDYMPRMDYEMEAVCIERRNDHRETADYTRLLEERIEKARDIYYNPQLYGCASIEEVADYMASILYTNYRKV